MIKALPALALFATTAAAVMISTGGGRRQSSPQQQGEPAGQGDETKPSKSILEIIGMEDVLTPVAPRGIRNNNPLNIELGDPWQGLAPVQTDGRFAQFIDPRYGYRAAAKIMRSYAGRGVQRLADIIRTWAPSHENNVSAYVDSVSSRSGIGPLELVTPEKYVALFEAMTMHENGQQPYSRELIAEGVSWANA